MGRSAPSAPTIRAARAPIVSGAPFTLTHRPSSPSSTVAMVRRTASKRNTARRPASRRPALTSAPSAAAASSMATSVGSPDGGPAPDGLTTAVLHAAARRASRPSAGVSSSAPAGRATSPAADQAATGRIRFSVSVPVLSVQITVAAPSVSTADSRFTSAPRRLSARTHTARARVMVGRRPSGTFATSRPIANFSASATGRPAARSPSAMNTRPAATATAAISHATRRTSRSSGLGSRAPRCDSAAIRPSSVRIPVARTRPTASPPVHSVPLNTVSRAWSGDGCASSRPAARCTGADSPLSADMSTSTAPDTSRASAETRSPSSSRSTSPVTSSRAGTAQRTPSRSTVACGGRNWRSASMARSACRSWITATAAFSTTTQTIAIASVPVPARAARPAAAQSSSARGWTIWAATCRGQAAPPRRSSSFGPWAWSRRAASRDVSPDGSERRSRKSRSTGSSGGPELTARRPSRRCAASAGR